MLMTNAIKPTKITIKKVESEWYNYFNTLNEITRLREEITNPFDEEPDNNTGGGVNSVRNISDPTAKMATRLMTSKQLAYLTEIVEAIDQVRSEEHTSELQSRGHLVCRLLLEKKNNEQNNNDSHTSK